MQITLHPSDERGVTEMAWLNSRHSFSFGHYYNPHHMGIGALRVLNDDYIDGGFGFAMHSHENMEIVTIILSGAAEHKDSLGHQGILKTGDVQRMSAGKGIRHSEYNASKEERLHLLQIWVIPDVENIDPSYEQKNFSSIKINELVPIVTPKKEPNSLFIYQDATFYLGTFEEGKEHNYSITREKRVAFVFVITGELNLNDQHLKDQDGAALSGMGDAKMKFLKKTELLVIEIPQ